VLRLEPHCRGSLQRSLRRLGWINGGPQAWSQITLWKRLQAMGLLSYTQLWCSPRDNGLGDLEMPRGEKKIVLIWVFTLDE